MPTYDEHTLSYIGGCSVHVNTDDGSGDVGCAVQGFVDPPLTGDTTTKAAEYNILTIEGTGLYSERGTLNVTLGRSTVGGTIYYCGNPQVSVGTGRNGAPSDILSCETPCFFEWGA